MSASVLLGPAKDPQRSRRTRLYPFLQEASETPEQLWGSFLHLRYTINELTDVSPIAAAHPRHRQPSRIPPLSSSLLGAVTAKSALPLSRTETLQKKRAALRIAAQRRRFLTGPANLTGKLIKPPYFASARSCLPHRRSWMQACMVHPFPQAMPSSGTDRWPTMDSSRPLSYSGATWISLSSTRPMVVTCAQANNPALVFKNFALQTTVATIPLLPSNRTLADSSPTPQSL
jgi:hypothetical protein